MLFSFTFCFTSNWMSDPFVQVQVFHDTWLKREGRVASVREPKDGELLHWWEFLGVDGHWNVCSGLHPRLGTGARCPILPLHGGHLCVYHAEEERPTLGVQAVGKTSTGEMTHCAPYYSRLYLCVFNTVRVGISLPTHVSFSWTRQQHQNQRSFRQKWDCIVMTNSFVAFYIMLFLFMHLDCYVAFTLQ